jgi:adenylate cyclase
MARNERATLEALDAARAVFARHVALRYGRIVDTAGDSVLAVFNSVAAAIDAALAVQRDLALAAVKRPDDRLLRFRIGIHLGDVVQKQDGSIYGNGVNVAARVQALAKPGAIAVSAALRGAIGAAWPNLRFRDHGTHKVRTIDEPVHIFRLWNSNATTDASPK